MLSLETRAKRRGTYGIYRTPPTSEFRLTDREGRIINVCKLVALDITLHGTKFILVEFGIGTPVIIAVGLWLTISGPFLLGLYLFLTGLNYVPLLFYAIVIVRARSAEGEVAYGLAHDRHYNRRYSTQQLIIFIPLVVLILALYQYARM